MKQPWNKLLVLPLLLACAASCDSEDSNAASEYRSSIAQGTAEATLTLQSQWGSGYCANVSIRNDGGSPITSWSLTLDVGDATINNLWNGRLSGSTVSPESYNATIAAASSVSFGFCASAPGPDHDPRPAVLVVEGGDTSESGDGGDDGGTSGGSSGADGTSTSNGDSSVGDSSSSTSSSDSISSSTSSSDGTSSSTSSSDSNDDFPPLSGGCSGYATRFWDCCKPHCGWPSNVPGGMNPMDTCSASDALLSDFNTQSSCNGGDAHTCYGMAPWAIDSQLAFGYAATSSGDVCGRCYQLEFTGSSHNAGNDPGSQALAGKTMIVQAINVGHDVSGGQFDIMVPGGGVGAFNGCSSQWGVDNTQLGAQYGGFLTTCKQQLGWSAGHDQLKQCVAQQCTNIFEARGLTDLAAGCRWFVEWFQAADNPALHYKEIPCPSELSGGSGMDRSGIGDLSNSCG